MTFSDARVVNRLANDFVCAWKNIRPEVKFRPGLYDGREGERTIALLKPGTGATNICAHVATAEGKVLHSIPGYLPPEAFLKELDFALEAARRARDTAPVERLKELYEGRRREFLQSRTAHESPLFGPLQRLERDPLPPLEKVAEAQARLSK